MGIEVNPTFQRNVGDFYGTYMGTLDGEDARVDLFVQNGTMVAYIAPKSGSALGPGGYGFLSQVQAFAVDNGYGDHLRLIHTSPLQ